jgi:hypothetical protein
MRKLLLSLLLASSLTGCAVWDWIKPASDGISVDTEIVAGDKKEEIATGAVVGKKEETHNTADVIHQTYETINKQAPWWVIVLLIIGWVLPEPSRMWAGIKNAIMGVKK